MSTEHIVRSPEDQKEIDSLLEILRQVFSVPEEYSGLFAKRVGSENFRVVLNGHGVIGGLALIPMGQYFAGRSVPMVGIAAVGISPEHRGGGAATTMMAEIIRELHGNGYPLSGLYPATMPLYRRAGYEQAGSRYHITIPLDSIGSRERGMQIRPIESDDEETVRRLYTTDAMRNCGMLDRGEYVWGRVKSPRFESAVGYIVHRDGEAEGYVYLLQKDDGQFDFHLQVSDLVALTPEAGRRLLAFLGDHGSIVERAELFRSPTDPILTQLDERTYSAKLDFHWMLRIVDVPAALRARGYPSGVEAELHFNVSDDGLTENCGRFVLEVKEGVGTVSPGGDGRIDINVRGLAMLYSGHQSPMQLLATKYLNAEPEHAAAASAVFAGPDPWMPDMF